MDEIVYAGIDDDLRFPDRILPRVEAVLHHFGEVINGVQEHVAQFRDFRFHVARHGQVDDEQRAVFARLERALDHALAENW